MFGVWFSQTRSLPSRLRRGTGVGTREPKRWGQIKRVWSLVQSNSVIAELSRKMYWTGEEIPRDGGRQNVFGVWSG